MTAPVASGPSVRPAPEPIRPRVVVLVCGASDRGDDGAGLEIADRIRRRLPAAARLRVVGQLDAEDLLDVPDGAAVIVVDAATGPRPGAVVDVALSGSRGAAAVRPRSTHALAVREAIDLAQVVRGRPFRGRIVAIGGSSFGLGAPISPAVERGLPAFADAVLAAVRAAAAGG
jgi:hydrogenase maturation protease